MDQIVNGEVIKVPDSGDVYVALYQTDGLPYWSVSGVIYHRPDEARDNLAAFHPTKLMIVRIPSDEFKNVELLTQWGMSVR